MHEITYNMYTAFGKFIMNNKRLEQKLRNKNKEFIIRFIEKIEENPAASELVIENAAEMSGSHVIDGMIIKYLKDLGVKIRYTSNIDEEKKLFITMEDHTKKRISKCINPVHFIHGQSLQSKRDKASQINAQVFVLNGNFYVVCTECHEFEKL